MTDSHLVYKLEGRVTEIDVFKLAPTLLALGELIQDSNRVLFPNGRDVGVNVRPFREGSFIVDVSLFSPSNLQHLLEFLKPHSLEQLQSLLECIGLVGTGIGTTTIGAVRVIKLLRGKPKGVEEIAPGEFRYTAQDDNSVTVSGPVHNLLSNSKIVQNIFNIYGPPMLDAPEVDDVRTYIEGQEDRAEVVKREELPVIADFVAPSRTVRNNGERIKETLLRGVYLNPKRGAFGDDPKDWSFYRGDDVIVATIKDRDFLAKTASGEYRLNQSDLLTVDLLEKQKVKGTVVQKPVYEIIKVTDYRRGSDENDPEAPPHQSTHDL